MAKIISISQLKSTFHSVAVGMINQLTDEVYNCLQHYLNDYYSGWTPDMYERTYAFLSSGVKVDAHMEGDTCVAKVYIDCNKLNYNARITGFDVATWANTGFHGGLSVSHQPHVWRDTMNDTLNNGTLINMAVAYLKAHGFNVR
ncbi:MAG: hypothetical protein LUF92_03675 [Clostridiales bacterium]|nr:hypothetical protein [Clostridiales bacterium]